MSSMSVVRRITILVIAALLVLPLSAVVAQADQPPAIDAAQAQSLIAKARQAGSIRVILGVQLRQPFRPEGELDTRTINTQRQAIQAAQQAVIDSLADYKPVIHARFQFIPYLAIQIDEAALNALLTSPLVTSINEDVAVPPTLASSIPVIGADNVWDAGYDGTGWTVAVLDTGVQWDHAFFGGSAASRVVSEACYSNAGGGGGGLTLCPDSTYSQTVGHASSPTVANCLNGATNICTHGSHVAGIVAGQVITLSGVARNANLIGVQVFTRFDTEAACGVGQSPCVLSYSSDQILGLERVYALRGTYNIAAVNMSLGGGKYTDAEQALCDSDNASTKAAIDTLRSVGIATIIATGNNGYTDGISAPGCISTAVGVGATTDADTVASFSNSSNLVDLLAPGVSIDSSVPPNTFGNKQGTSMATPHVAGAWALLKSLAPTATITDVLTALQTTGAAVTDSRNGITKPRIQVDAAAGILTATTWVGNSSSWATNSNWSTGLTPSRITNVTIPAVPSGGNFPIVDANAAAYDLTIASGARITMTTPYIVQVSGNWNTLGTGAFNATTGTVVLRGDRPQTIAMTANTDDHFYNLQIGDGSTLQIVSPSSNLNVDGNLEIKAGAILSGSNRTLNVASNWIDNGSNFAPGTSTVVLDGSSQSAQKTSRESIALSENFASRDGGTDGLFYSTPPGGWAVTNAGTNYAWLFGYATALPNSPNTGGHARHLYNSVDASTTDTWLFSPAVDLSADLTYRLEFAYGARYSFRPESLQVSYGSGQTAVSMTTALYTNTNIVNTAWNTATITFTVPANGAYNLGFHAYTAAPHGELAIDNIRLTAISNLMFYNVAVNSTGGAAFMDDVKVKNDLAVSANGIMDLGARTLTVDGALTNNGTLRQQKNVSAATEFLHIQNAAGSADKYFGIVITPTATALQTTTVDIKGNQLGGCTTNSADALIFRCYKITPFSAQSANLKLYFTEAERHSLSANALTVWHYDGPPGQWTQVGVPYTYSESGATCTTGGGTACWLQATGVSTYSPFGAGTITVPTAVQAVTVSATSGRSTWWLIGLMIVGLGALTGLGLNHRRARRG